MYDSEFFLQTNEKLEELHEMICSNEYEDTLNDYVISLQEQIRKWCYSEETSNQSITSRKTNYIQDFKR